MQLNLGAFKTKVNQKTAFLGYNFPIWVYYVSGGRITRNSRNVSTAERGHDPKTSHSTNPVRPLALVRNALIRFEGG